MTHVNDSKFASRIIFRISVYDFQFQISSSNFIVETIDSKTGRNTHIKNILHFEINIVYTYIYHNSKYISPPI